MFPVRERSRNFIIALVALLIATQIVFLGIMVLNHMLDTTIKPQQTDQIMVADLKDNWELETYENETLTLEKSNNFAEVNEIAKSDKLEKLAAKYKADPEYLDYIVKVEKIFALEPCELLALIAQESGFKPQTHMDGGSLSYSTTQMKLPTAKTAHMAITEYYKMDIPYPTHELLNEDKFYATFLAGGYLRYLHDTYQDKYESYTAYNWGIGGRMQFYKNNGHFKSPYALKVANLGKSFNEYVGKEYYISAHNQGKIGPEIPAKIAVIIKNFKSLEFV
jgi:hypothetical protein